MTGRWKSAAAAALCVLACACLLAWTNNDQPAGENIPRRAAVGIYILGPTALVAGSSATYRIAVHWARSPRRAGPLPGAEVTVSLRQEGGLRRLASGRSDRTGSVHLGFVVPRIRTGAHRLVVQVAAPQGKRTREKEIKIYPGGRLLLTTDKKLYQPTQTIHVRALALRSMDLKPVSRHMIKIVIKDPKGTAVFSRTTRTSRFGVASLDFTLADEINLGSYAIEAWTRGADAGGRTRRLVKVKRYVLPRFRVSVETDRPYYRPGDTVRGTVRARYFFGKPVARGRVTLDVRSRLVGGVTRHSVPAALTDAAGRRTFELQLPGAAGDPDVQGELRILASVKDTANHIERGDRSVVLTRRPLQLSVVTENERLIPGVRNRVHVIAGYLDGRQAAGARVRLKDGRRTHEARADSLGVATFDIRPTRNRRRCRGDGDDADGSGGMALAVQVRDERGQRRSVRTCAPLTTRGSVLVRPARSLVKPGQPVELTLLAGASRRFARRHVFLDVVKAGQTLATYTRDLRRGRATFRFHPTPALFGLLELRGYRVTRAGERVGTSRMVYVDHPGKLKITAAADRKVYRPGSRARIRFQVVDSRTGDGVQAALGLLAIDESVVALGGLERSSPRLFFTLASQARGEGSSPETLPGGRDLEHWVGGGGKPALRARAADVLLAAVQPAAAPVWETNPWKERRAAWKEQAPELISAAISFMASHSVGRRTPRGWRFAADLVPRMARAKSIEPGQVNDPWQQIVRPWHLRATDRGFMFAPLARKLAPRKLERIYEALVDVWEELKLPREKMKKLARQRWPLILRRGVLRRVVEKTKLTDVDIVDPWGKRFRVVLNPGLFVNAFRTGLVSRYLIQSAGPDGRFGTRDDVIPRGPRKRVAVFGRDSALGSDAEDALGCLIGNQIGEAYGVGGLGLVGSGRGGGGSGSGTIGLGTFATIGKGGGGSMPARVRSSFPETLFWRPEVITDAGGRATVDVDIADSITTWKMVATGSSMEGLLGRATLDLRVFQDFFVDIDLPTSLTRGDRVSVPVTVYNYLKTRQRVTLRLKREAWYTPGGPAEQTIELGPSEVGVRYFPVTARRAGRHDLTIRARSRGQGAAQGDAVRRSVQVEPDGVEHAVSHGGALRGEVTHDLSIPAGAIAGTGRVSLSVYPGPLSQTLSGMEAMLRMPSGCFEQTSSTTYPNVLVLDYLRRTKKATPRVEKKARALINAGYQRLISFEVEGGGFSWFGAAPANKILTAYGLMEFHDMSRVHPVDPKLIARTQRWLASKQGSDGSWGADRNNISEGATNRFQRDRLRITAYIAHALRHTGYGGRALKRALTFIRLRAGQARDPYTLALLGNLLRRRDGAHARGVMERLWRTRRESKKGLYFDAPGATLTHGAGRSGRIETTALAALALLSRDAAPRGVGRVIDTLVSSKDSFGSWYSTQATILSLRALLLQQERNRSRPTGRVEVLVDGQRQRLIEFDPRRDAASQVELPRARAGRHRVTLRFAGQGNLQYQLVGRFWLPRGRQERKPRVQGRGLFIATRFDRSRIRTGKQLRLDVEVSNRGRRAEMPLVSLALPPGFAVQESDLTRLVKEGKVDKVQRVGARALLYLSRMERGKRLRFTVGMRGKYPLKVQARPSVVYEYYRPENRSESRAHTLQVM